MSETARGRILERLRSASVGAQRAERGAQVKQPKRSRDERVVRLRTMMEAVRTEFLEADRESWPSTVLAFLVSIGAKRVLHGANLFSVAPPDSAAVELVPYDKPIEEWKTDMFSNIDAAITTTRGGIAETGTLILWPSPDEPRLMSLVPPVHVALLDTNKIHDTFADVMRDENWAAGMPPNALLISGPSKTADIEQTLAYGVHGPKRLIVVLVS
ncbi:MAG TPA: lactate utilization protein [Thermoanaerobaculia bacterium]